LLTCCSTALARHQFHPRTYVNIRSFRGREALTYSRHMSGHIIFKCPYTAINVQHCGRTYPRRPVRTMAMKPCPVRLAPSCTSSIGPPASCWANQSSKAASFGGLLHFEPSLFGRLLALFGPDGSNWRCPFIGAKRTSLVRVINMPSSPKQSGSISNLLRDRPCRSRRLIPMSPIPRPPIPS
jgi:hypothetical protein